MHCKYIPVYLVDMQRHWTNAENAVVSSSAAAHLPVRYASCGDFRLMAEIGRSTSVQVCLALTMYAECHSRPFNRVPASCGKLAETKDLAIFIGD